MKLTRIVPALLVLSTLSGVGWGQRPGFGGPAVMTRPGAPLGRSEGATLAFRPFVGVTGRYDGNLFPAETGVPSALLRSHYGVEGQWGVYGVRRGERSIVGLSYAGSYRHYAGGTRYNGTNQFLNLTYTHQLSQRTVVFVSPGFGIYKYGLHSTVAPLIIDPFGLTAPVDPNEEGFDARTYAYSASAGVGHQLSERWSVMLGGGGYYIERKNLSFISSQGANSTARLAYQIGPTQQIGLTYTYSFFFFPRGFGESHNHTLQLEYAVQLSPRWRAAIGAGVLRSENDRLARVVLDPEIAALTGQPTALEAVHRVVNRPAFRGTLGRQLERGALSFFYRRDVHPGNGFISSAVRDEAGVSYSYTATERLNLGFHGSGYSYESLMQELRRYNSFGGGMGLNYALTRYLHFTARFDIRRWGVTDSSFDRDRLGVTVGFMLSPGETPLALW